MRFADNNINNNSVLDLMFINLQNSGFNNHHILQDYKTRDSPQIMHHSMSKFKLMNPTLTKSREISK